MKVLLIQAYIGGNEPPVFPLGLSCIATSIPEHEVRIIDPNTNVNPFPYVKEQVKGFKPVVVGISLRNIDSTNKSNVVFYYAWLKDLVAAVKETSSAIIVVGGSGFSMFAEEIMNLEQGLDFGVYLEGEIVFADLLNNLQTPYKVASIFYREGGKVLFSGKGSPVDVNSTAIPGWNYVPLSPYVKSRDAIGIETKRGCSLGCVYCVYGFLNGRHYRLKEAKRVVDEIELLVERLGVAHFTFVDSIFNVPIAHARAICEEILARKITVTWSAWFSERFLERDFISLLVRAGCNHIILSPDGFSDAVLQKLGKNFSKKNIVHSLRLLRVQKKIEVSYNFFRNPPGQSLANYFGMLFFCLKAKLVMGKRVHFEFSVLRIEPHTGLYRIAVEEGVISAEQSLLKPTYYSNHRTRYLEAPLNFLLSLKGK